MNAKTIKAMKAARKGKVKSAATVEELLKELNSK